MEEWKDVEGFKGIYQVSNNGSVKSVDRTISVDSNHITRRIKGSPLCGSIRNGYRCYHLRDKIRSIYASGHRLVAIAFVSGRTTSRRFVNHKDGDKLNNSRDNLEWTTPKENSIHGCRNGGKVKKLHEALTRWEIDKVIELYSATKMTRVNIGKELDLPETYICSVVRSEQIGYGRRHLRCDAQSGKIRAKGTPIA